MTHPTSSSRAKLDQPLQQAVNLHQVCVARVTMLLEKQWTKATSMSKHNQIWSSYIAPQRP